MSISKLGVNIARTVVNSAESSAVDISKTLVKQLTQSESVRALKCMREVGLEQNKNIMQTFVARVSEPLSEAAVATREKFIITIQKAGVPPKVTAELKKAKTWGELQAAIFNFADKYRECEIVPILNLLKPKHIKTGSVPLEIEQMFYHKKNLRDDCVRWLHALFARPSTHPEVISAEKLLCDKYGLRLALLGDDVLQSRSVLSAVDKAKQLGVKLPDEIIISNYKNSRGEHLKTHDGTCDSIILSSNALQMYIQKYCPKAKCSPDIANLISRWKSSTGFKSWFSTTLPEHISFHELCHQEHLPLLAFKCKKIPKRYKYTVNSLSGYAASKPNAAHEAYTELNVKNRFAGFGLCPELTDEEKSLFKYLGGDV